MNIVVGDKIVYNALSGSLHGSLLQKGGSQVGELVKTKYEDGREGVFVICNRL